VPLSPGTRLGPYEILAPLGAGGMGEVYKAHDARLDRSVAVKVLSPDIASSPEARQRFEREARTISQLSHPHICAIYDVGHEGETQFLVMELLDGETLVDRLGKGPLPIEQTLRYGVEIADALDNAHRQGIVHRDLKPGNVMLTKGGVKLLDFGLAKAVQPLAAMGRSAIDTTPAQNNLTEAGMFVGTLQYMAPEQVTGGAADTRSDIFALGTVLYEMTTGARAFSGSSRVALTSAILNEQPGPMSSRRPAVSPMFDRLVQVCLAKDPDDRWQHARDVALQLRSIQIASSAGSAVVGALPAAGARGGTFVWIPWLVAAAATAVALMLGLRSPAPSAAASPISFAVSPPTGTRFAETVEVVPFALSPDGAQLAMATFGQDGRSRVWIRAMSSSEPRALAGTEGADSVFWSPDSRSIGFFAGNKMKRVDIQGGTVVPLCDVREGIGKTGTWGRDGQILFAAIEGDAIYRTSTAGEAAVAVLKGDRAAGGLRVLWPSFLPDGQRFFYLEKTSSKGRLMLGELGTAPREVMPVDSNAHYLEPDYVVFAREGILLGQKLNRTTLRPEGGPLSIANPVRYFFATGAAQFSVSSHAVAYQSHGNVARIARIDRSGREGTNLGTPGENARLSVSRDGQTAVFDRLSPQSSLDIWSIDLARGIETRLTSDPATEAFPVLVPGTRTMIFGSTKRGGPPNLVRKNLDTGAEEFLLPFSPSLQEVEDVTRDGRTLLFSQRGQGGQYDLWTLPLTGGGAATPYLNSPADETSARFSPDGRFVAYVSNDSGRREVHVASFPAGGVSARVSSGGGRVPRWSADGRELFYISGDGAVTAVPIRTMPALQVGRPVALFTAGTPQRWAGFDVAPDGGFLAIVLDIGIGEQPLSVVLNWKPETSGR
jgi:Tol biopolymer transport system component